MKQNNILAWMVLVALFASSCGARGDQAGTLTPQSPVVPVMVSASGKVLPARWANLSCQADGRVANIAVQTGDKVEAGQVLVRLDDTDARLALAQANASLKMAQAQLAQQKAGARSAEIVAAEQAVKEAEASLWNASAQLAQLQAGPRAGDTAEAQAQVARAQAELKVAQDAYDALTTGRGLAKEYNLKGGGLGLYEEQQRAQLAATRAAFEAAQKRLEQLQAGSTKNELDAARANVAAMQAQKARAQAQLDLLKSGASPEQIAVSEANVTQAQVAVDIAQAALDKTQLKAPFAGTVGTILMREGELLAPGQVTLVLGDLGSLRVETTDLSEADVARVSVGQIVSVTLDALKDKKLAGQVTRIAPMSSSGQGGVNYAITIELDQLDPALRWGMTAFADIQVQ